MNSIKIEVKSLHNAECAKDAHNGLYNSYDSADDGCDAHFITPNKIENENEYFRRYQSRLSNLQLIRP